MGLIRSALEWSWNPWSNWDGRVQETTHLHHLGAEPRYNKILLEGITLLLPQEFKSLMKIQGTMAYVIVCIGADGVPEANLERSESTPEIPDAGRVEDT